MEDFRNDSRNSKLKLLIQPNIGLDCKVRRPVVNLLHTTLAD